MKWGYYTRTLLSSTSGHKCSQCGMRINTAAVATAGCCLLLLAAGMASALNMPTASVLHAKVIAMFFVECPNSKGRPAGGKGMLTSRKAFQLCSCGSERCCRTPARVSGDGASAAAVVCWLLLAVLQAKFTVTFTCLNGTAS